MCPPQEASPFAGIAATYDRFRAPYPPAIFAHLTAAFVLDNGAHGLDLGCGPGTIAIPLAAIVAHVVAVDPDADMLAEGQRLAAGRGRRNISWRHARAEDLPAWLGPFRVVTLGQSFHWMDRDRVLQRISPLIEPGGGLALINPGRRRPQESWEPVAGEVVARYLGPPVRHPAMNPEPAHEPALHRSAHFARFTAREYPACITRDVAAIRGCLYATSGAARHLFGSRAAAFERDLADALLRLNPSGVFRETLETEIIIAPKSNA